MQTAYIFVSIVTQLATFYGTYEDEGEATINKILIYFVLIYPYTRKSSDC